MKLKRNLYLIRLTLGILTTACFAMGAAEVNSQSWNATEEDIKSLVVMIDVSLKDAPRRGAGIICGVGDDSLYIVTANHVVREGKDDAEEIQLKFKWFPDKPVKAILLPHRDAELDFAVLRVNGLNELKINPEDLPFDRLGDPGSVQRGDEIYLLGYPRGIPWRINTKPENFAGSRGDSLEFESSLITGGHSGGALLDENLDLIGMLRSDVAPYGEAISITRIISRFKNWGYPVNLGHEITPSKFSAVRVGASRVCALNTTGRAYCWGQVGTHWVSTDSNESWFFTVHPTRVKGGLIFQSLDLGYINTCGVAEDGSAYCWGTGRLGNDSTDPSIVPVRVSGGLLFHSVRYSPLGVLGLTRDGKLYRWGIPESLRPQLYKVQDSFRSIDRDCGLTRDDAVKCFYENAWSQTKLTFQSLSGACALTSGGAAYCLGKLGSAEDEKNKVPLLVPGGLVFQSISAGEAHACGITLDGTAYCWGEYNLGNGTKTGSTVPVPVSGKIKFKSLSLGGPTCGVSTDGKIYCWGWLQDTRSLGPHIDYGTVPTLIGKRP